MSACETFGSGEAPQATGAAQDCSLNAYIILYLGPMTHSVAVAADALLARAQGFRRAPKGVNVTDRLLSKLKAGWP